MVLGVLPRRIGHTAASTPLPLRRSAAALVPAHHPLPPPQAVCGQALSLLALLYLDGQARRLGLLLGALVTGALQSMGGAGRNARGSSPNSAAGDRRRLQPPPLACAACGFLGVSGCVFRDVNQLAGHIVGGLLIACMVFGFVTQARSGGAGTFYLCARRGLPPAACTAAPPAPDPRLAPTVLPSRPQVASEARFDCAAAELQLMDSRALQALQRSQEARHNLLSAVQLRLVGLGGRRRHRFHFCHPAVVASQRCSPAQLAGLPAWNCASLPSCAASCRLQAALDSTLDQLLEDPGLADSSAPGGAEELRRAHARELWRHTGGRGSGRRSWGKPPHACWQSRNQGSGGTENTPPACPSQTRPSSSASCSTCGTTPRRCAPEGPPHAWRTKQAYSMPPVSSARRALEAAAHAFPACPPQVLSNLFREWTQGKLKALHEKVAGEGGASCCMAPAAAPALSSAGAVLAAPDCHGVLPRSRLCSPRPAWPWPPPCRPPDRAGPAGDGAAAERAVPGRPQGVWGCLRRPPARFAVPMARVARAVPSLTVHSALPARCRSCCTA